MKILPSNLNESTDIKKVGNEYFFKKDLKESEIDNSLMNNYEHSHKKIHEQPTQTQTQTDDNFDRKKYLKSTAATFFNQFDDNNNNKDEIGDDENYDYDENDKRNIDEHNDNRLRDVRSTSGYDKLGRQLGASNQPPTTLTIDRSEIPLQINDNVQVETAISDNTENLRENEIFRMNKGDKDFDTLEVIDNDDDNVGDPNIPWLQVNNKINMTKSQFNVLIKESDGIPSSVSSSDAEDDMIAKNIPIFATDSTTSTSTSDGKKTFVLFNEKSKNMFVINTEKEDDDLNLSSEEKNASYEDYSVIDIGRETVRKNKFRVHTSFQKTAIHQPLLQQGFIATPGYPKYYVGDSNCVRRITVPNGRKIRITILDINLRCK